jgi:diadenosine tetraphosphate (Ap4A) HIT family hydrolase
MDQFGMCRFCNFFDGKYSHDEIDHPFVQNDSYMAIASIGALIEGWSLIIPKKHQLSMRNVYGDPGFADFCSSVISRLMRHYGPLIAFEHGSNKEGSITSCGTDHAHLHLVPFRESLIPELQNSDMQWIESHASEIASKTGNSEYLFYTELGLSFVWNDPVGHLHNLVHPKSQYFRHLLANRIGVPELSDYKKFPHLETAQQTRDTLVGSLV